MKYVDYYPRFKDKETRHSESNCPRSTTTDDEARIWTQANTDGFWIHSIPQAYIVAFLCLYLCLRHCFCIMFFRLLLLLKAHQYAKVLFKCHFFQDAFSWLTQLEASSFLRFLMEWNFTLWDTYWLLSYMVDSLYLPRCLIPDYKPPEGRTFIHTISSIIMNILPFIQILQMLGSFMMAETKCLTNFFFKCIYLWER